MKYIVNLNYETCMKKEVIVHLIPIANKLLVVFLSHDEFSVNYDVLIAYCDSLIGDEINWLDHCSTNVMRTQLTSLLNKD